MPSKSSATQKETLALAAHYLWLAAKPAEPTQRILEDLAEVVRKLERYGPTVGALADLSRAIALAREHAPLPYGVEVRIEGRYVVVRVECVPEEHPVLIPE